MSKRHQAIRRRAAKRSKPTNTPYERLEPRHLLAGMGSEFVSSFTGTVSSTVDYHHVDISADGRYVVFNSDESGHVSGDNNGMQDTFVRDLVDGTTIRVSTNTSGGDANGDSYAGGISDDGRFVVFSSSATDLVANDVNGKQDVFVRDLQLGTTTLVSTDAAGNQGNDDSSSSVISGNGQFVVIYTKSTNFDPQDEGFHGHLFLKDLTSGSLTLVSSDSAGTIGDDSSSNAAVSDDGRYVAFMSAAENLVANDLANRLDVFLKDTVTGVTTRLSANTSGADGSGHSYNPVISGDGRYVAFDSSSNDLIAGDTNGHRDIFVVDRILGTTTRANLDANGAEALGGHSRDVEFSGDGRYITFESEATNLTSDTPGTRYDIFVKDLVLGSITRVTTASDGAGGDGGSYFPAISDDGHQLAFISYANNLPINNSVSQPELFFARANYLPFASVGPADSDTASFTYSGEELVASGTISVEDLNIGDIVNANVRSVVVDGYTNGIGDSTLRSKMSLTPDPVIGGTATNGVATWTFASENLDFSHLLVDETLTLNYNIEFSDEFSGRCVHLVTIEITGTKEFVSTIETVSKDRNDGQSNGQSWNASVSGNGRFVVFESDATDLVFGDDNSEADIFVRDMLTGETTMVSTVDGNEGNDRSERPEISSNGRFVVFSSWADNLVANVMNSYVDVYVKDLATGTVTPANTDSNGVYGNAGSNYASISADGRYVAFYSGATNLVANDTNGIPDLFVKDMKTGAIVRANTSASGAQSNASQQLALRKPSISGDGRYVVFESDATNLVPGDTNGLQDVFVKDLISGSVQRFSSDSIPSANHNSRSPTISKDGRSIAFISDYVVYVNNEAQAAPDLIYANLDTGELLSIQDHLDLPYYITLNVASDGISLSEDGRLMSFSSGTRGMVSTDRKFHSDAFVFDTQSMEVTRYSTDLLDRDTNAASIRPSLSDDGRFIVFDSYASNMVDGDTNGELDVFRSEIREKQTFDVGNLNQGIAVEDGATGNGYIMFSEESVHSRFASNPTRFDNSDHFVAVRWSGTSWQYNNNVTWVDFDASHKDVLLAEVDFDADTTTNLFGTSQTLNGIDAGFTGGDLQFIANSWGGNPNGGEFEVTGTTFKVHGDGLSHVPAGNLGGGVAVADGATGLGYLMYSSESVHTRFASSSPNLSNADHFIAVRFDGTKWQYNNNVDWVDFVIADTDRLMVVGVNFETDLLTSLEGQNRIVMGMAAGYIEGDLSFAPNVWNGSANDGEFGVTGTEFTFGGIVSIHELGGLGSGIAVADDATGNGYLMHSSESVHSRFFSNPPYALNSDHFIAVRLVGDYWQYNDNNSWIDFAVAPSDVLVAEIDFDADLVTSLWNRNSKLMGMQVGFSNGILNFYANSWNGSTNSGEFEVAGTTFKVGGPDSETLAVGNLGSGIAATDNAVGDGYMMYSSESVHSRFANAAPHPDNSDHFIAVRFNGAKWQYNNNAAWVNFVVRESDTLVASIDFDTNSISGLLGVRMLIDGMNAGFTSGELQFIANSWNGSTNNGEFEVIGTDFTIGGEASPTRLVGPLGQGIGVDDNATGLGYLMYSSINVHSRFSASSPYVFNSDHFIAVRWTGTVWQYNNNSNWVTFTTNSSDILVASLDFDADTANSLQGANFEVHGVSAGYQSGDLTFLANSFNGSTNAGEFEITGTSFAVGGETTLTREVGPVRSGVAIDDSAVGFGYIMYSSVDVHTRFNMTPIDPDNAQHFIAIQWLGTSWGYNDDSNWIEFTSVADDVLVAYIDFDDDAVYRMQAFSDVFGGIQAGYEFGNLAFTNNSWGGVNDDGEVEISGSFFNEWGP